MRTSRQIPNRPAVAALALGLALAACAEPPPSPTTVALGIETTADMNGGAPAKVKVYYLTSDANFRAGDFFSLFNDPGAALGQDLVAVDEYLLAPGDTASDTRSFDMAVPYIGVVAGLREVDRPGWKAIGDLAPRAANPIVLTVSGEGAKVGAAGD
jgi:type VI secretion system protein VasD